MTGFGQKWSISYYNIREKRWERRHYYSIKEFLVSKHRIKNDPNFKEIKTDYKKYM